LEGSGSGGGPYDDDEDFAPSKYCEGAATALRIRVMILIILFSLLQR